MPPKKFSKFVVINKIEKIVGSHLFKLPSKYEVLGKFLFEHVNNGKTIQRSAVITADNVLEFWHKARVPTSFKGWCIKKVKNLFNEYRSLKKNEYRRDKTTLKRFKEYAENLNNLFDIAHSRALQMMTIEEDKEFLLAQRMKGRKGFMQGVDKKLARKELLQVEREERQLTRKRKAEEEKARLTETAKISSDSSSDENPQRKKPRRNCQEDLDFEPIPGPSKKRGRKICITEELASTLDRTNISNRKATFILAHTAKTFGQDINQLALNEKSVRAARAKLRKTAAEGIQASFSADVPLVVHWDGKLLPELIGKKKVDRLPILVSGENVDQLLNVPALSKGTGEAQAIAVCESIKEWKIEDKIKGMCFDTTATNSGTHKGACTLIEQSLKKPLLNLACRHHIPEIILESAVKTCIKVRNQPEIPVFRAFKTEWENIDQTQYRTAADDDAVSTIMQPEKNEIINFVLEQLKVSLLLVLIT